MVSIGYWRNDRGLGIDPQTPTRFMQDDGGGVFKSSNGERVVRRCHGQVTALAIDPQTPATIYMADVFGR